MASTAAPYGLVPVRKIGSDVNNGGFSTYQIASGYNTAIFFGDVVKLVASGTIEKDTGTATATPIGVFLGCEYVNSDGQLIHSQMWPASTTSTETIYARVLDDPDALFMIQADGTVAQADVGLNAGLVQTAGSTTVGKSKVALDQSTLATTNTLPLRVLAIHTGPENAAGDAFTDVIVKWNVGHQLVGTTGV